MRALTTIISVRRQWSPFARFPNLLSSFFTARGILSKQAIRLLVEKIVVALPLIILAVDGEGSSLKNDDPNE
jgi:hypothetical protein